MECKDPCNVHSGLSARVDECERRIEKLDERNEAIVIIGESVRQLADQIKELVQSQRVLESRMVTVEKAPGKIAISAWRFFGGLIVSGLVGYGFALLK